MSIHFEGSALTRTTWREYAVRFGLGGLVTACTGLIGTHLGAEIGGLFLAFPAIFPASATLLDRHERERKQRAGIAHTLRGRLGAALDARGASLGAIALGVFGGCCWKGLSHYSAAAVLPAASFIWLALAVTLWRGRKWLSRHGHGGVPQRPHSS